MYKGPRNTVEGFNAYLKDDGRTALHQAGRRRLRGYTAQFVLTTMLVVAANLRKTMTFMAVEQAVRNGEVVRTRAPRRSQTYRQFKIASVSPDAFVSEGGLDEENEPEAA
jgi:hypothetical protein